MSVAKPDKGSRAKARTVEMPLLCSFNGFDAVNWVNVLSSQSYPFKGFYPVFLEHGNVINKQSESNNFN